MIPSIVELLFHRNDMTWYLRCTLVHPSMAQVFFRSMIAYLMIHVLWFKGQWSKLSYVQYILMEVAYHYMYSWSQGCTIHQATLLVLLLHSFIHYYVNHVLILKKQESLYEYYRYVTLDLMWLCMKNEYMRVDTGFWLTLYLLWIERVESFLCGKKEAQENQEAQEAQENQENQEAQEEEEEEYDDQENLMNQ